MTCFESNKSKGQKQIALITPKFPLVFLHPFLSPLADTQIPVPKKSSWKTRKDLTACSCFMGWLQVWFDICAHVSFTFRRNKTFLSLNYFAFQNFISTPKGYAFDLLSALYNSLEGEWSQVGISQGTGGEEKALSLCRGGLDWIIARISSQKGWLSIDQVSGGVTIPGSTPECVEVLLGDIIDGDHGGAGGWLDLVILKVFFNLDNAVILQQF